MPRRKKQTPAVAEVRPYLEGVAKNLVDKLFGPDGPPWGTSLSDLEDLVLEVRQALSQHMLALAVARQAQALPAQPEAVRTCPGCHQPLPCEETRPRTMHTRAGDLQWSEPEASCPRCRRAFFPSVPEPGHRPVPDQPGPAPEDRLRRH